MESKEADKRIAVPTIFKGNHSAFMFDLIGEYEDNNMKAPLFMISPNITSMLLNISDKYFAETMKIWEEELVPTIKYEAGVKSFMFNPPDQKNRREFDFIEKLFTAIVFAYSSVEAMVNNLIPRDFKYEVEEKKHGITYMKILSKDAIERFYNIEEKINKILPKIYKFKLDLYKKNGKEREIWDKFKILIDCRNKIVHPRTNIIKEFHLSQVAFIAEIFWEGMNNDIIKSARDLIENLCEKNNNAPSGVVKSPHIPFEFAIENPTFEAYKKF